MRARLAEISEITGDGHSLLVLPERKFLLDQGQSTNPGRPGLTVRYREVGQGTPALLLHSPWTSIFAFRNLIKRLQETHRLIIAETLDLVEKPAEILPKPLAASILSLIKALELKQPIVVGQAECGLAGLHLTTSQPEALSGLVIIDSALSYSKSLGIRGRWLANRWMMNRYAYRCFSNPYQSALTLVSKRRPNLLSQQEIRYLSLRFGSLPLARHTIGILAQTLAPVFRHEADAIIQCLREKKCATPVMLVGLDKSNSHRALHRHEEALRAFLSESEIAVAEVGVEDPLVERPEWVAGIVEKASKAAGVA